MRLKNIFFVLSALSTLINVNAQTYKGTQPGKVLRDWYVAGPIRISTDTSVKPDNAEQEKFFNRKDDQQVNASFGLSVDKIPDLKNWKKVSVKNDIIDFDSIFKHPDFVSAYAYAVIVSDEARHAVLGVGSDDALKVWHNGKLVHRNWIPRGIVPDNDIIPLSLVKGKNELIVLELIKPDQKESAALKKPILDKLRN